MNNFTHKLVPYTAKQYSKSNTHTVDFMALQSLQHQTSSFQEHFLLTRRLLSDNRKNFRAILGPRTFVFKGTEHEFDCWRVQFHTAQYTILTAKNKGTSYETDHNTSMELDQLFLLHMGKLLAAHEQTLSKNEVNP